MEIQYLGIIDHILSDERNITIIGACNPYRYRGDSSKRLSGLIFNYKQFSNPLIDLKRLGDLAYVVYNLPDTMKQLVWDFGAVTDQDERAYISEMVNNSKKASKLTKLKYIFFKKCLCNL